jgi:hypothetical protein
MNNSFEDIGNKLLLRKQKSLDDFDSTAIDERTEVTEATSIRKKELKNYMNKDNGEHPIE